MSQSTFSIRMDEDLKRDFSEFCNSVGMSMTTAFVVFARKTLNERRIPFVIDNPRESEKDRLARHNLTFTQLHNPTIFGSPTRTTESSTA